MFDYGTLQEDSFPAPQVSIEVRAPDRVGASCAIEVILDTGAAMTVLPASLLDEVDLSEYGKINVLGAVGKIEEALTAFVSLQIGPFLILDQEVVILDRPYGLLGRDVVNAFRLELDAPKSLWKIEE
jgi:hypothetical protein